VALHGNLRDFGIGEVFQLIGQQGKTGLLEVVRGDERICIAFEGGAVVWGERAGPYEQAALGGMLVRAGLLTRERLAELEQEMARSGESLSRQVVASGDLEADQVEEILDLITRDTIFVLLRWAQGSFHFTAQRLGHSRPESRLLPAEQILMDGLRMVDEWRTLDPDAVRPDTVFQRADSFEVFRQARPGTGLQTLARAEQLYLLIDGRLPVRRVVDLSRLGDFEGARLLSELRRAGVIEPLDPALVARSRRRSFALPSGPSLGAALLAMAPFLLLAALVGGILRAPAPALHSSLLHPDPALEVRLAWQGRALRNALLAHRFARGAYPDTLADLGRLPAAGSPAARTLAAAAAASYYYEQRGEGSVVLAPELPPQLPSAGGP